MVLAGSDRVPPAPPYSGSRLFRRIVLKGYHPLWHAFPGISYDLLSDPAALQPRCGTPHRFGRSPFRSPLLGGSLHCFLFLQVLRCFSSLGWRPCGQYAFSILGFPIRRPMDLGPCAAPHGLSQLAASFFASRALGIHHAPLFTSNILPAASAGFAPLRHCLPIFQRTPPRSPGERPDTASAVSGKKLSSWRISGSNR